MLPVERLLASPRRRRRLGYVALAATVAAGIAGAAAVLDSPQRRVENLPSGLGAAAPKVEPSFRRTDAQFEPALVVARAFVGTAVARKDVARSFDLVTPSFRKGYSRSGWASGDIPVVPYPVDHARWRVDYSFRDSVGLKVALYPRRGAKMNAVVFLLDLERVGKGRARRWLVSNYTPSSSTAQPAISRRASGVGGVPRFDGDNALGEPRLGLAWFFVPLGVFFAVVLIPVGLGIVYWVRVRRAERAYAASTSRGIPHH